jgi:hypothetical protein
MVLEIWQSNCNSLVLDVSKDVHVESREDLIPLNFWAEVLVTVESNIESEPLYRA